MNDTTCSQAGCQIETSGRCLEGFEPVSECPYYAQSEQAQDEIATYNALDLIDLPSGEALTEKQASEITRDDISKLIIIAGPTGSGKTTILTSLFEAFLDAPFANYLFRGSRTLVGFERRCHLGREESGFDIPDTTHTSVREGVVFLHLDLASIEQGELLHTNLLLSDISGELFKRLRDSSDAVRELPALKRADYLCLVIDGEKIVQRELRQVARNDSRSILRSIIEAGVLARDCIIDIAFTKWDVVVAKIDHTKADQIDEFIEGTKSVLCMAADGFQINFHEIAARPAKDAKVPFAHGLPTLLRSWMGQEQSSVARLPIYSISASSREFSRFTQSVIISNELEDHYDIHQL